MLKKTLAVAALAFGASVVASLRNNDHRGRDNEHRDYRGHDNDRRGDGDWRDRRN